MERKHIVIGHFFSEYLNMFGDSGNIKALEKRLLWRDIDVSVVELDEKSNLNTVDIVLLGGGADKEHAIVLERLKKIQDQLKGYIESGGVFLALCGGFSMLGKSLPLNGVMVEGLSLLDMYTEIGGKRQIGDVVIQTEINHKTVSIVGFENHSGRTFLNGLKPFGTVKHGYGNNGEDSTCGVLYKNLLGTYLHGPILPKNPVLCDDILYRALSRKYGETVELMPLNDRAEQEAHDYMINRILHS